MPDIIKVAILPITNKRLLMCRKKGLSFLVNLGGTKELGEGDEECAAREVWEEARCEVKNLRYWLTSYASRQDKPGKIELRCYFGDLVGEPRINPNDTIYEHVWIDRRWEYEGYELPLSFKKPMSNLILEGYL